MGDEQLDGGGGGRLTITALSEDHALVRKEGLTNIRLGDRLAVERTLDVVQDPEEPGREMDRLTLHVGDLFITGLDLDYAMGIFSGPHAAEVGDIVVG